MWDIRASLATSFWSLSSDLMASLGRCLADFDPFYSRISGRYANNSNYKNDTMIRKEAYSHQVAIKQHLFPHKTEEYNTYRLWWMSWGGSSRTARYCRDHIIKKRIIQQHISVCRSWLKMMSFGLSQTGLAVRWTIASMNCFSLSRVWWQLPGAWDCDWGRAHLVHNQQDRQLGNQRKSSAGR